MNHNFMDSDILSMMDTLFDEGCLNASFARTYPALADELFAGPRFPVQAIDRLGAILLWLNVGLTPLMVAVAGLVVAIRRRSR